ncbi:MAG: hypothetical protein K2X03_10395 [Bryobacteraceae bacterium]|nr:hypothetical protein [Bryobacteraceae bacterium]
MPRPVVLAGLATYVAFGGLVRHLVEARGWSVWDLSFAYLIYWVAWAPKLPLAYRYAALWLLPPFLYLTYSLKFADALALTVGCYITGLATIRASRWLAPAGAPDAPCCH